MRITVQLQLRQYDFPLKMLPMFLDAYWWGIQVPHAIAPAHYLLPHSSNSVIAQIVTAMQLPRMLKVTHYTVGRLGVIPNFSAQWVTIISYIYGATIRELRYKNSLVGVEVS